MPASSAYSLPEARAPRVPRAACMVGSSKSFFCAGAKQAQITSDSGRASLWFIILSLIIALRFAGARRRCFREALVVGDLREDIGGSATWAAIDLQKESAPHQLHVVQPL